ncbi:MULTISPECIES: NEW3 domain-containing protein [Halorussus]|uniref:NEW3 domain-containing protein n=1 Tax=Halorussus TaxID=1070314 RepID=UPI0020A0BA6A|nr:NEW3 domain-containing protein [Halorussus vallis]USZ78622.1 NEW3 domain-containing protein [Halorussus vallis]
MQARTLLSTALMALLLVSVATASGPPQTDLHLTTGNASTTAGNTATLIVTATNTGNQTIGGNYTLTVNNSTLPDGWQADISNQTLVRGPFKSNESRSTTIRVSVPANASVGDTTIQLLLSSGERVWANATADITVQDSTDPSTSSDSDSTESDDSTEVSGGGGGFAAVAASSSQPWWAVLLTPEVGGVIVVLLALLLVLRDR